jgi:DNA invertase Pin-like site-specific DNA recombinase
MRALGCHARTSGALAGSPSTRVSRFFLHVLASLAERERDLTVERTRAGSELARQLGRKGGRKRQMTDSKVKSAKKLLTSGMPPKDVFRCCGLQWKNTRLAIEHPSRPTIRLLRTFGECQLIA